MGQETLTAEAVICLVTDYANRYSWLDNDRIAEHDIAEMPLVMFKDRSPLVLSEGA